MKRIGKNFAGLFLVLVGLLVVPLVHADAIYNFSVDLTNGTVTGTVTGTIDLLFVNPGGTGSGVASSVELTSIPAGFGVLAGGNTVTAWANQLANAFSVTAGFITSYYFAADTGPTDSADFFQINNTTNTTTNGIWGVSGNEAALDNTSSVFGYVFSSTAVTFTPAAVPEPPSPTFLLTLAVMALVLGKKPLAKWKLG